MAAGTPTVDERRIAALAGKGLAVVVAGLVVVAAVLGGLVGAGVLSVGKPTVTEVRTSWGEVTESTTRLHSEVVVRNPNFVAVPAVLDVRYRATMNGVTVAEGVERNVGLRRGETRLDVALAIDNDEMVDWWIRHVNNGGRTRVAVTATVDGTLGFSRQYTAMQKTIDTNMLKGLEGNRSEGFVVDGRQVAVVTKTAVEWGNADGKTTPLKVHVTVENTAGTGVTVRNLRYFVAFNGVTMGEGVDGSSFVVGPGETKTLTFTIELDTAKVDDWWVTHVRNGETTVVETEAWVTVAAHGRSSRFHLRSLSSNTTVETNFVVDEDQQR